MLTNLFAGTLSLAGVACLLYSWRRDRRDRSSPIIWVGWLLMLLSLPISFVEPGWEFGLVYGLSFPALFAWLVIFFSRETRRSEKRQEVEPVLMGRPAWVKVAGHLGLFLATVPLLGVASIPVTLFLVKLLPADDATQMLWSLLFMPLIWGGVAAWICGSKKIWLPLLATLLSGILASLYLYL